MSDRRTSIKWVLASAIGLTLNPNLVFAKGIQTKRKNIIIVGLGNRGKRFIKHALLHPELYQITTLIDQNPKLIQEVVHEFSLYTCQTFHSMDEIKKDNENELVYVSTNGDNTDILKRGLHLNLNVWTDKPVINKLAKQELLAFANQKNLELTQKHLISLDQLISA